MAAEKRDTSNINAGDPSAHREHTSFSTSDTIDVNRLSSAQLRANINAKIANPLAGYTLAELADKGEAYAREHQIGEEEDIRAFRLGAMLAQDPNKPSNLENLDPAEKEVLDREITKRWSQPKLLYLIIVLCSTCAAVQGMDETVVNGAQIFYSVQFGIGDKNSDRDSWLVGLLNSAPYLCCATIGCWLTIPFNHWFGRRGTIFLTCCFSALACFWQGFTNTWWHMFIARFCLGFGIGPKSATVPIYAAECTPPQIRGALVMQWQMWVSIFIHFFLLLPSYPVGKLQFLTTFLP